MAHRCGNQDADLWIRHPARRRKAQGRKVDARFLSVPPQSKAFDTADLRKSIDEVEQQQKSRRTAADEYVEVDLRVNTAKAHVEQQEALLRQTSSNPWFLFYQDILALKDAKGNKIYSKYGDARARVVSWVSACSPASAPRRRRPSKMASAPLQQLQSALLPPSFRDRKDAG